jgi:hypothetical protein
MPRPSAFPTAATPAYTPVQARRSLAHNKANTTANGYPPSQPNMSAPDADSRKRVEFPPPVRSYVQRCFAPENQIASVTIPEMQEKLKIVITEAAENGKLEKIDWERLPLPQVMVQNERNKILANPASSNWASLPSSPGDAARKRKSTDPHQLQNGSPPWRKANNRFEDRVTHPTTDKKTENDTGPV